MIYVSTGGFRDLSAVEAASRLAEAGISHVELSGGRPDETWFEHAKKLADHVQLRLHNYFPPPTKPFVLNLASADASTLTESIQFCKNALRSAHELGDDRYAVHAGFLIDPAVNELGRRIQKRKLADRREGMVRFKNSVAELASFAATIDMTLLIENNVLSAGNFAEFGENPLLLVEPEEIKTFFVSAPDNVELLVDVAHLKVSAQTLGFDPTLLFDLAGEHVGGYHLSDNDGRSDSNDILREDSWFWSHLNRDADYFTIEVYGRDEAFLRRQVELVERWRTA